jgi:phytoene desaturase
MNHADFGLGTWYPKGGFNAVAKGIEKLARELGVEFRVNEEVVKIENDGDTVTDVITKNGIFSADLVISGADYAHTEKLIDAKPKNYADDYWQKKVFAPSSFLYYVAFDKKWRNYYTIIYFLILILKNMPKKFMMNHNSEKTSFYANFSSKTDNTLAPEGKEVGFF